MLKNPLRKFLKGFLLSTQLTIKLTYYLFALTIIKFNCSISVNISMY